MHRIATLLLALLLAIAGCGGDDEPGDSGGSPSRAESAPAPETGASGAEETEDRPAASRKGTTITVGASEFGTMLFDSRKQAIYVFERDPEGKSVCDGDCAEAWPPVFTDGEPRAARGVRQSLLGTTERGDGRLQATYAGKPLYFYAHEGRGEVRCHNVNLNGGLWWVVGPDGKRRP